MHFYCFVILCSIPARHLFFFFFHAEDGIRDTSVTGVQTCALPATSPGPEWRPAACDEPLRRESSSWLGNRAWLAGVRAFHHLFRGHSRARPHTPAARGAWDRFRDACAPRGWCQTSPRRLCLLQNGLGGRRERALRGQCPSPVARAGWY